MVNQATPLAAKYYTDATYFTLDRDNISYRSWQCVCHVSEVANAGDYATLQLVGENIFVIRDRAGELHAYYDVCRHRGHPLVEGFGQNYTMLPQNHGLLAVGRPAAEVFVYHYYLEMACKIQVDILSCTHRSTRINDEAMQALHCWGSLQAGLQGAIQWPAMLRMLDREQPDYRE